MFKFLALLALAASAFAATLSRDLPRVFPSSLSGRIVGGVDATIEEVPHQISLVKNDKHNCGGSIISEYWIVTAAHCVGGSLENYIVRAGSADRTQGGSTHTVAKVIVHENFGTVNQRMPHNDIALIRLNEPFKLDETRQVIALFDSGEETPVGVDAIVTGWGLTRNEESPEILQTVTVPIIDKSDCTLAYLFWGGIPDDQICTAYTKGRKSICHGDSGGPLTINGRLTGIASWVNGCGELGYPSVYTEVAAYRQWIKLHSEV